MRNVVRSVFRSVLHTFEITFENPKLPFDSCKSAIRLPNNPHARMIQTLSASVLCRRLHHLARKCVRYKITAAISEPASNASTHFLVLVAKMTIHRIIKTAINPLFILFLLSHAKKASRFKPECLFAYVSVFLF